ncbi:MAG: hypothetical protein Terrestrivirus8_19 [Terrestrivirus sp.]|uniref:Uncharacterized protein n=1 Tax=Terrestrivirus sp. TaxID=2487775 RepID=A0A3G4ZNR8_9VIRU|nr:MAG: hypothetical protein Terrestrivirus8_19 [Terrestrivirus sp.]
MGDIIFDSDGKTYEIVDKIEEKWNTLEQHLNKLDYMATEVNKDLNMIDNKKIYDGIVDKNEYYVIHKTKYIQYIEDKIKKCKKKIKRLDNRIIKAKTSLCKSKNSLQSSNKKYVTEFQIGDIILLDKTNICLFFYISKGDIGKKFKITKRVDEKCYDWDGSETWEFKGYNSCQIDGDGEHFFDDCDPNKYTVLTKE